jgi:hypothetical protein
MTTRKRTKWLTMISKTLLRKLTIEEQEQYREPWVNSGAPKGTHRITLLCPMSKIYFHQCET